jgi:hypothetical protein
MVLDIVIGSWSDRVAEACVWSGMGARPRLAKSGDSCIPESSSYIRNGFLFFCAVWLHVERSSGYLAELLTLNPVNNELWPQPFVMQSDAALVQPFMKPTRH